VYPVAKIADNLVVLHLSMSCGERWRYPFFNKRVFIKEQSAHENLSVSIHGNHERGWLNLGSNIIDFSHQTRPQLVWRHALFKRLDGQIWDYPEIRSSRIRQTLNLNWAETGGWK